MNNVTVYNYEFSLVKAETVGYDENKFIKGFYIARLNKEKKSIH